MSASRQRQPWPMKWVVLAIVLLIVPYTFVTLRYRKEGPAFQPYEDMKNRANVARLLSAGYQRIPIVAQRPSDPGRSGSGASILPDVGGLPPDLRSTLVEVPQLPTDILSVTAAAVMAAGEAYAIQLACSLPNDTQTLGGAELYVREDRLVVLPTFETIAQGLTTRSRQAAVLLTIPAGALKPGTYQCTLVGEKSSRSWPLEVK